MVYQCLISASSDKKSSETILMESASLVKAGQKYFEYNDVLECPSNIQIFDNWLKPIASLLYHKQRDCQLIIIGTNHNNLNPSNGSQYHLFHYLLEDLINQLDHQYHLNIGALFIQNNKIFDNIQDKQIFKLDQMHTASLKDIKQVMQMDFKSPSIIYVHIRQGKQIIQQFQIVLANNNCQLAEISIQEFRKNKKDIFIQTINNLNSSFVKDMMQLVYVQELQTKDNYKIQLNLDDRSQLLEYIKQIKNKHSKYKRKNKQLNDDYKLQVQITEEQEKKIQEIKQTNNEFTQDLLDKDEKINLLKEKLKRLEITVLDNQEQYKFKEITLQLNEKNIELQKKESILKHYNEQLNILKIKIQDQCLNQKEIYNLTLQNDLLNKRIDNLEQIGTKDQQTILELKEELNKQKMNITQLKDENRQIKNNQLEEKRQERDKTEEIRQQELKKLREVASEYRELSEQVEEILKYHSEMNTVINRQDQEIQSLSEQMQLGEQELMMTLDKNAELEMEIQKMEEIVQ